MKCVAMSIKGCVFPGEILKTFSHKNTLTFESTLGDACPPDAAIPVLSCKQKHYICKEKVKNKMLLKL
jgi:hypothetical protein